MKWQVSTGKMDALHARRVFEVSLPTASTLLDMFCCYAVVQFSSQKHVGAIAPFGRKASSESTERYVLLL